MGYATAKEIAVSDIPVIDIAPLVAGAAGGAKGVAEAMGRAAQEVGFFYISNHGVPEAVIQAALAASQAFFALPLEQKLQVQVNDRHRGFIRIGEAKMHEGAKIDLKESYIWGLDVAEDDPDFLAGKPLVGPNNWPGFMPELRAALVPFYDTLGACGRLMFQAFAASLDVPEDTFTRRYDKPISRASIIYYPQQPPDLGEAQFGVAPHTDYGCMTLLLQDDAGGLQVRGRSGEWLTAHPIEGTIVVNVGDLLARWTNDHFISTPHRVVNRSGRARYSMGLFVDPDYDTTIEPVCHRGERPRYEPVTCGDYVLSRLNAAFAYRK
jgi:isopenicillin N synthase-like dioxygenase